MLQQTQAALRRRIHRVMFDKEVAESRKAAEKALHDSLSLNPTTKRGNAGKQPKQPKEPGQPKAEPSGGDADLKGKLSHANRQLQAMAAQVREAGKTPVFVKKPDKGGAKGNKGNRSRSPSPSPKNSNAGSDKTKNAGQP